MTSVLKAVDERTKLAGANKLEMLMFTLGSDASSGRTEVYGINVFKVREVMRVPVITKPPELAPSVEGLVSIRGVFFPVINLVSHVGLQTATKQDILIVTEYNGSTQGFLVNSVDTILRLSWSSMKAPPQNLIANRGGLITAITELPDGRVVLMMDVEKILAETSGNGEPVEPKIEGVHLANKHLVYFVDDSSVARRQIEMTLRALGVRYQSSINGRQAWDELQQIASSCDLAGIPVREKISCILTDVEMPEMDGYLLTKMIKQDPRFKGIPVIMHSSLSSIANQTLGRTVGVDAYVSKFEPQKLADTLAELFS